MRWPHLHNPLFVNRQQLYSNVLYVDANPAVGSDSNNGDYDKPYLTITAAVAAASEYTVIFCTDSRVGAAAVGFDEDAAITGVSIPTNYILLVGYSPNWVEGHKIPVRNTIGNADNVFNIAGDHCGLMGLDLYLQDINGDEITVLNAGNGFRMEHCDLPGGILAAQNVCIKSTGNNIVLDYVHTLLADVGLHMSGVEICRVRNCTFQGGLTDGVRVTDNCIDLYFASCQWQACGDAIDIEAGSTFCAFYEGNFANNTQIWNNAGGVTNRLINAKQVSQILAGNTAEQDRKAIYDLLSRADASSGTLNDANPSDTIIPSLLPCAMHLVIDISNLNNNGDDFLLEVKCGVALSERVIAYYALTSDGTDITVDTGSGARSITKNRRIDIDGILVAASEQVLVEYTKNGATDRDVSYKYVCGGGV